MGIPTIFCILAFSSTLLCCAKASSQGCANSLGSSGDTSIDCAEAQETHAVNVALLQTSRSLKQADLEQPAERVPEALVTSVSVGSAKRSIRDCPRLDARLLSAEDIHNLKTPTVLENAFRIIDNTTWARSDFEKDGPFGNISMKSANVLHNEHKFNYTIPDFSIPMYQAIEYGSSSVLHLENEFLGGMMASLSEKNNGVPFVGPMAEISKAMADTRALSIKSRGQWAQTHTHEETMAVQVTGRGGWIFGDPTAFQSENTRQKYGNPIPESVLSRGDTCRLFTENRVPPVLRESPNSWMACETNPGDAVFWPGVCGGDCGYWHGTCGLDDWNLGYTTFRFRENSVE